MSSRAPEPVVTALGRGWLRWVYEGVMIGLALAVVFMLTLEDQSWVEYANQAILGIFVVDYGTRLYLSGDRKAFVRRNVPDLIAILPLDLLRIARLARLARLVRLVRGGTILWRSSRTLRGVLNTNGLAEVLAVVVATILVGAFAIHAVEPDVGPIGDALWWAVVTTATVGYGDIAPATLAGRVIASVLMVVGIGTVSMVTGSIATYFIRGRAQSPTNPQVSWLRDQLDRWDELSREERMRIAAMLEGLARAPE